jgi:WhiB family redox-sensing transcriptional regulator
VTSLRGRDWRQLAACARPGVDPEIFFPGVREKAKARQAKQICGGCPVSEPCLANALATPPNNDAGIFAGTTPRQRAEIRRRAELSGRDRPSLLTDPGLAAEAFELARGIGTVRAAQELGVDRVRLYRAWDRWRLGRPHAQRPTPSPTARLDPLGAQRAFRLAEEVGLEEAAVRLGINQSVLDDAWERWGSARQGGRPTPARRRLEGEFADRTRQQSSDEATRPDVAEPVAARAGRARSGPEERER